MILYLLINICIVESFINRINNFNNFKLFNNLPSKHLINQDKIQENLSEQNKYDLSWYVIGFPENFAEYELKKITIWNKNYVVWKQDNIFHALDDVCSHKSASLSLGQINNGNIMCPYHGYLFNHNGTLVKVPGINFKHSCIHDIKKYNILVKNNWVYMNTHYTNETLNENIYNLEEDINSESFIQVVQDMDFNCYSRLLSENSLDVMHIGFVHTFGNSEEPAPITEQPPFKISDYHYKTIYTYKSGENSMAKKMFSSDNITIENEFILPHTTIARVKFNDLISTVETFALPINLTSTKLFVKTYRNFWTGTFEMVGNGLSYEMMYRTLLQDKRIVESIDIEKMDGKFNMKYDKLQNTYVSFYKKFVHKFFN
jgi:phenylpropionate dioxygenase-like ring-hydroxylating dioxygenase large terminal subunit